MGVDLSQVETIVVLMFENRSFDHLLGHLSLAGDPVDGLRGQVDDKGRLVNDSYSNGFEGLSYYPFRMSDGAFPADLPHGRDDIETTQLALSPINGKFTMKGFVKAYYSAGNPNRTRSPEPMGFLGPEDAPISNFLAREFAVCDRWFSCIPADTHANRLFSISGFTKADRIARPIATVPNQRTFLDWLTDRGIRWRVYRNGLSFFTLMPQYLDEIASGQGFRSVSHFAGDWQNEARTTFPQVVVIEPSYLDSPVDLEEPPNDNHPPLPIAPGEDYLRRIYTALTANKDRWAKTVFIVTYDEHGGFYDHVPPPKISSSIPPGATYTVPFRSTGVRIPALVVSPFVQRGTVFSETLDNTSFLQLLADRFAPETEGFSPEVNARRSAGIGSVSRALNATPARTDIPTPPPSPPVPAGLVNPVRPPTTALKQAFVDAAKRLDAHPAAVDTHPGLKEWNS
jgi:phospholipase C